MLERQDLSTWEKCLDSLPLKSEFEQRYVMSCFRALEASFKREITKSTDKKMNAKTDNTATIANLKERILKIQKSLQHPAITVESHEKLSFDLQYYQSLLTNLENVKN